MKLISCAHPGKIGDTLFALPAIRELCRIHQAKADFFVRPWCEPARSLIEYQPYINSMRTDAPEIQAGRLQPLTDMPPGYDGYFDISWTKMDLFPLPESLAEAAGLPRRIGRNLQLDIPEGGYPPGDYIVLSARSQGKLIFEDLFEEFCKKSELDVYVVGGTGDHLQNGYDACGISFLAMAQMIAHAKAYVGVFSSPLVVAQAFPIPKTCVFDGVTWHPTQIIMDGENSYLVNPTVNELLISSRRDLTVKRI